MCSVDECIYYYLLDYVVVINVLCISSFISNPWSKRVLGRGGGRSYCFTQKCSYLPPPHLPFKMSNPLLTFVCKLVWIVVLGGHIKYHFSLSSICPPPPSCQVSLPRFLLLRETEDQKFEFESDKKVHLVYGSCSPDSVIALSLYIQIT